MREITTDRRSQLRILRVLICTALALLLGSVSLPVAVQAGSVHLDFAGGSRAEILPADEVLAHYVVATDEGLRLELPGYGGADLMDSVVKNDQVITDFFAHDLGEVIATLESQSCPRPVEYLRVVILPYPRKTISTSSASGNIVFLSPGILDFPAEITHMVLTHELGHVVHNERMPDHDPRWQTYRQLRGIEDELVYSASAMHRNRPKEIFAEDFRYLFGDALSTYSGSIENADLPLPDEVAGLREFFLALTSEAPTAALSSKLVAAVYPNPFNPRTTISVEAEPDRLDSPLSVQVFDARGRLVRELYGGRLTSTAMSFAWNGVDEQGREVPAGAYFSLVRLGEERVSRKMILVK